MDKQTKTINMLNLSPIDVKFKFKRIRNHLFKDYNNNN